MTHAQVERFALATLVGCMSAVAAASILFALSLDVGFSGSGLSGWYFRLHSLDLTIEMFVLGGVGYALPRIRYASFALRVGAALGVLAIVAEIVEWLAELDSPIAAIGGSVGARLFSHIADFAIAAAVIAAWYVTERRAATTNDA